MGLHFLGRGRHWQISQLWTSVWKPKEQSKEQPEMRPVHSSSPANNTCWLSQRENSLYQINASLADKTFCSLLLHNFLNTAKPYLWTVLILKYSTEFSSHDPNHMSRRCRMSSVPIKNLGSTTQYPELTLFSEEMHSQRSPTSVTVGLL